MNHLVIAVTPDSSLDLLGAYADIILLDIAPIPELSKSYETVYIRSHFSRPDTMPQNFRKEISGLVDRARQLNPSVTFIDNMDTVDGITNFEDKLHQYQLFSDSMPRTELLEGASEFSFKKPIFKNRLSSRGSGVSWTQPNTNKKSNWIIQESIDIQEELRIYIVNGAVIPVGAIRNSMTADRKTQAVDSRKLSDDEIEFATAVASKAPELDLLGLDIAKTVDGQLYLMEANRSPGFAAFEKLTRINIASVLYEG